MAESTLKLTFRSLQIRCAEELGFPSYSGGAAAPPTDAADLELCKRLVNDGVRDVYSRHDWNFLKIRYTLTLVAGTREYNMPDSFTGDVEDTFTYGDNGPYIELEEATDRQIRARYATLGDQGGDPYMYAFYKREQDDGTFLGWNVIFYPEPSTAHDLTILLNDFPEALSDDDDRHVAGARFDFLFEKAVRAAARMHRDNVPMSQDADYVAAVQSAIRMDDKAAPRRIGYMRDDSEPHGFYDPRRSVPVSTYNGVDITP